MGWLAIGTRVLHLAIKKRVMEKIGRVEGEPGSGLTNGSTIALGRPAKLGARQEEEKAGQ